MLEDKYGKFIILKPYNDDNGIVDNGIVDNKQQKYIKQIIDISDEEGLRLAYEKKMVYNNIVIIYLLQEQRTFQSII